MKYFTIIFIIGFLWLTRDIIRVPENFNDSFFKKFKGYKWIDPQVSSTNQYVFGYWMSFIISTFSDLYHTLGTIINWGYIGLLIIAYLQIFHFSNEWLWIEWFLGMCVSFGLGSFTGQWLWREKLNKESDET